MVRRFRLFLFLIRNFLDYPLRQFFRWRRKGLRLKKESKENLFSDLPDANCSQAQTTAERLLGEYHMDALYASSTRDNYRENLYYLGMLESALSVAQPDIPNDVSVADIGPSHWFYVQALYAGIKYWCAPTGREVRLTGYERDAYRVYVDLYSRFDHAQAHMRDLPGVTYLPQAFKAQPGAFDIVIQFFPFIFLSDHLEWGLPPSLLNPSGLLMAAWLSLKPGGLLLIVNQGKDEQQAQLKLLRQSGIPILSTYPFNSPMYHYDYPRFITLARHEDDNLPPG